MSCARQYLHRTPLPTMHLHLQTWTPWTTAPTGHIHYHVQSHLITDHTHLDLHLHPHISTLTLWSFHLKKYSFSAVYAPEVPSLILVCVIYGFDPRVRLGFWFFFILATQFAHHLTWNCLRLTDFFFFLNKNTLFNCHSLCCLTCGWDLETPGTRVE